MSSKKTIEAVGAAGQIVLGGRAKHIELLDEGEFQERFVIPNGVFV